MIVKGWMCYTLYKRPIPRGELERVTFVILTHLFSLGLVFECS